jgi:hypothetical protein
LAYLPREAQAYAQENGGAVLSDALGASKPQGSLTPEDLAWAQSGNDPRAKTRVREIQQGLAEHGGYATGIAVRGTAEYVQGQAVGKIANAATDELQAARAEARAVNAADEALEARTAVAPGRVGRLRDARGRYVADPANPPSPFEYTDAQRRAAWRQLAEDPQSPLTDAQRQMIRERGWRGPQRTVTETGELETMELSHEPVPLRDGGAEVVPRWPDEHAAVDPHRHLKKPR